jgi:zinc transport system substrate-binding protein
MTLPPLRALAALLATALALAGCATGPDAGDDGTVRVVASFYPLEYVAERVGGEHVRVSSLTAPGAEPHDLELGAKDLVEMIDADLVVYAAGFQPAVDEGLDQVDPAHVLEVSEAARMTLPADGGHDHDHDHGDEHAAEATDAFSEEEAHGDVDPHFWLDPTRYADVANAVADRLATDDPANAEAYAANAATFVAELTRLDEDFAAGLASCETRVLVTSHAAFAYLADRYDLDQHGIAGLSPEAEPSASALKEITDLVTREGISTIYQETLVEPNFARTVAQATGATIATLDPIEGITDESAGDDYLEVMRANLEVLRKGQQCR